MQWAPLPTSESSTLALPGAQGPADGSRWSPGALEPPKGGLGGPPSPRWASRDPRTSSTQSLASSNPGHDAAAGGDPKRTLLVVYIHGFMGNNASFRSFPAHVHSFLKALLAETHTVHTKIYPRYKTYKSIDVACDNFSRWLAPHESPETDVVLVGHSMGGLLAAEVVLLPSQSPYNTSSPFRHRIVGTISLDAPLLGLHPGIVVSGIASLFRPAPSPPLASEDARADNASSMQSQRLSPDPSIYSAISTPAEAPSPSLRPYPSSSTVASAARDSPDPNFDPPFVNDVAFVDRGWVKNILHFANKHKEENLVSAAANHIVSHLEFGACLADYPELRSRYSRLRRLEDVDDWRQSGTERVRFVNYYTVSTGVIKMPKPTSPTGRSRHSETQGEFERPSLEIGSQIPTSRPSAEHSRVPTPRISIEEYGDEPRIEALQLLDPIPEPDPSEPPSEPISEPPFRPETSTPRTEPTTIIDEPLPDEIATQDLDLPTIPDVPPPPTPPDLDACPDKESRKQAKDTFKLAQKAHAQAVKARDKAIKERDKAIKDHQKALDKQQRKAAKLKEKHDKQATKLHKPPPSPQDDDDHTPFSHAVPTHQEKGKKDNKKKPPRRRKFCMTPSKSASGARDPAWVEVYMEGVDEVGAHCGLFVPGPHYERLVGDVGERIAAWVWEDASRRVLAMGNADGHGHGHEQGHGYEGGIS